MKIMKNILTVLAFAGCLIFGTQTVSAQSLSQNQDRPEVIAKEQSSILTDELGLDGDQTRAVFRALVTKEVNYQKNIEGKDLSSASVQAQKQKFDTELQESMKKILTDDQYKKWLSKQD